MSETVSNQSSLWIRHKKKWLFLIGILGVGLLVWLWWFLSQPVSGTIHTTSENAVSGDVQKAEKKLYKGKNITFSYEGSYEEKSSQVSSVGPIVESLLLVTPTLDGRKIAVTVAKRETDDLMSDPSYQVRVMNRDMYSQSAFVVASYEGVMFEKNEAPFEKTAFFSYRGLIVSIALTSLFHAENLEEELNALLLDFEVSLN